MVELDVEVAHS